MGYEIRFDPDATEHMQQLSAYNRRIILDAVEAQLRHSPTDETRHRKSLRPNPLARWELQVGDFRVFYDVIESESRVRILAIGIKKHNRVTVGGRGSTMKTLALENSKNLSIGEVVKLAAEGETVLLTENGEGRYLLGALDDLELEAFSLSRNQEFMRYLDSCRARGDREGNISLEEARQLLCPEE